ncbi:MAG: hypothetical protein HYZ53_30060 [Planctomycetes bacterium]|nr:hypothetical protein [Planctomycetota bacterium]
MGPRQPAEAPRSRTISCAARAAPIALAAAGAFTPDPRPAAEPPARRCLTRHGGDPHAIRRCADPAHPSQRAGLAETCLACLVVLVWHGYWVVLDPEVVPLSLRRGTGEAGSGGEKERP